MILPPQLEAAKLVLGRVPWRLVGYCVAALALLLFAWRVQAWREGYIARDAAVAHEKAVEAQAAAALAQLQERFNAAQAASKGFQDDLAKARAERDARRNLPARVVRLCQPAPAVPAPNTSPGGPDAAPSAAPESAATPGPDIGRELYGITDDGDEREAALDAQIVHLQELLRGNK